MQRGRGTISAPVADGGRLRWGLIAMALTLATLATGWYLLQPRRASRIASHTIRLQEELLGTTTDPASRRRAIEEIMRNIDSLPPEQIRTVRDALFRRLNAMRQESFARFKSASAAEQAALLDDDLDRISLARRIIDATDQGGMRPYTEAELVEREERRKKREEEAKRTAAAPRPAAKALKPASPKPQTVEQKQAAAYIEALSKRAKQKNVDLGRTFSRPPGRG